LTSEDSMSVVIPRNTSIPTRKKRVYFTRNDYKPSVLIKIYEGERTRASDNNLLGLFTLRGFPCEHADGILSVSAEEETTGIENKITIINEKGRLSTDQIMRKIQEAEKYKAEDKKHQKKVNAMNALDDYIDEITNAIYDVDTSVKICPEDKLKISLAIRDANKLLGDSQQKEANVFEDCLKELVSIVEPIIKIG
ncbi:heat shock 70 kDa protein, partial [Trifolium medium]|nr:heat shock 70 kDa protein [Trifolium medium]